MLVIDPEDPLAMLPGGTVEPTDASPEAALVREAAEEAQLTLGEVERLGWVYDAAGEVYGGIGECARLRLAAPITGAGPSLVDPATGRQFARLLATPIRLPPSWAGASRAISKRSRRHESPGRDGGSRSPHRHRSRNSPEWMAVMNARTAP